MPDNPERRRAVPFDPFFFEEHAKSGQMFDLCDTFRIIYETNHWAAAHRSGAGAAREQTTHLLAELTAIVCSLGVSTILDVPCGDLSWMRELNVAGLSYIGADVVPAVIEANCAKFATASRSFRVLDLTHDKLPASDLLLCRDCLVHFSFADARAALKNIVRSSIAYLLSTTFPETVRNDDIVTGDWRPINLERPPFSLPPPIHLLCEHCTEGDGLFADKSLALWRVDQFRPFAGF